MINLTPEIKFQTSRSGGKGGQHVNKVETAVTASFQIDSSQLLSVDQKKLLRDKLAKRITSEGFIQVKSQTYRTQLQNRQESARRLNVLVRDALKKKKKRIPTTISKEMKEKILVHKKRKGELKASRKKFKPDDH